GTTPCAGTSLARSTPSGTTALCRFGARSDGRAAVGARRRDRAGGDAIMDDHRLGRGPPAPAPRPPAMALGSLVLVAVLFPGQGSAQYFGRNKVQYDRFDFRVLHTPHFDLHHYPPAEEPAADAARMAERWYGRIASVSGHDLTGKTPIILYA